MEFTISPDHHEVRLDRFIRRRYPEVALTSIFRLIRKGRIRVNGLKRKQNYRLQIGDRVRVDINAPPRTPPPRVDLSESERSLAKKSIVYRDRDILLCNKPPGLVMHRGSGHRFGLVEMIRTVTDNPAFTFVNRIDKPTSGLVAGACTPAAARMLAGLFRKGEVEKYYLILAEGVIEKDHFTLESYLRKDETRVEEFHAPRAGADRAVSEFTVLKRQAGATLLEAWLHTGRTHQLRVQLAGINHPIRGDGKYGSGGSPVMSLFSRRIVIPSLGLDVSLPVPDFFPAME